MAVAVVDVQVKGSNAARELQKVNNQAKQLDASVKGVGRSTASATANIQRFGIAFRSVLGPIVAITGAVNLASRSLRVLGERQADAAALQNGLQKVGATSGELERLIGVADKLGKATLFNEEDFTKGFALLTSFQSIGVTSYERVAKAAADVAQVTRQDVGSSLLQLAKALQDPERGLTALARSGTQFTEQQKEQIKALVESGRLLEAQNFILLEIEKQYGNAAAAAGSAGYAGAVDSLQESFRDFQERLAQGIQPAVSSFLGSTAQLFDVLSKIPTPIGQAALAIGGATAAVVALNAAVQTLLASRLAAFIGTQVSLMQAFGLQIYATAAAQGALTAATKAYQLAVAAAPWALAALGLGLVISETYKAIAAQIEYNRVLREAPLDVVNTKIGELREQLTQATIEAQNAAVGMSLMGGSAEFSSVRVAQLNTQLGELISRQQELALYQRMGVTPQAGFYGPGFAPPPPKPKPPAITTPTGDGGKQKQLDLERQLLAAAQARIDTAEAQRQIELDLESSFQNQINAIGSANALLQAQLDGNEQQVKYEQQIEALVEQYGDDKRDQIELLVNTNKELSEKIKLEQEAAAEAKRLQQIYDNIGQTIASGVVDVLGVAFDRTKSLADAASNMLRNLANQLLSLGINVALKGTGLSLFQNLPGFANGGSIPGGKPAIVGEKGPELFVPGKSGTIIPNNALGGSNIVVNVDAGGSNVQGDGTQAKALGAAIGLAVQNEIIKQKKPGGLLY